MAYSMMSSTNHNRKLELLVLLPNNNNNNNNKTEEEADFSSFDQNNNNTTTNEYDWISLDLDYLAEADYYYDDDENENISSSSNDETSSVASNISSSSNDETSSVDDDAVHGNNNKKKKRKTLETFVDHDLEDTATSSPSHTPNKDNTTFNPFYMESKELETRDLCQENGNTLQQEGDATKMSLAESELRKKGLCLIPTSILLNYLTANA